MSNDFIKRLSEALPPWAKDQVMTLEDLSKLTTLRTGGQGRVLRLPNAEQAGEALYACQEAAIPIYVLGKGSNLIVADGFPEVLFLSVATREEPQRVGESQVRVRADAFLPGLLAWCHRQGLLGLEWAAGIPGTLGGAVAMNAGTQLGDMAQSLACATVLRGPALEMRSLLELELSYRHSGLRSGEIVFDALLNLKPGDPASLDVAKEQVKTYIHKRNQTQPLDQPSFGSTFANPPGQAAARLIEQCGLKGRRRGDLMVSPKHANFIVNTGRGTSQDAVDLVREVRDEVFRQTGTLLRTEVRTAGFLNDPFSK